MKFLALLIVILSAVLLAACEPGAPRVVHRFDDSQCVRTKTGATRQRQVQGSCVVRSAPDSHGSTHCIAYSHYFVTDHEERVDCSKLRWVD